MTLIIVLASSLMFAVAGLLKSDYKYYDYAGDEYAGNDNCMQHASLSAK